MAKKTDDGSKDASKHTNRNAPRTSEDTLAKSLAAKADGYTDLFFINDSDYGELECATVERDLKDIKFPARGRGNFSSKYQPIIDKLAVLEIGKALQVKISSEKVLKSIHSSIKDRVAAMREDGGVLRYSRTSEDVIVFWIEIPPPEPKQQKKGVDGARESVAAATKRYGAIKHESID